MSTILFVSWLIIIEKKIPSLPSPRKMPAQTTWKMIPSQSHYQACKFLLLSFHYFHRKLTNLLAGRESDDGYCDSRSGHKDMSGMPEFSLRESGRNVLGRREMHRHLHRSYFLDHGVQHRALESHPKEFSSRGICGGVYAKETASLPSSIHTRLLGCGKLAPERSIWLWGLRSLHRLCVSSRLRALWASLPASPLVAVGAARKWGQFHELPAE